MTTDAKPGLDTHLLATFLKRRLHDSKPTELISVETENAVPKGDNYASLVYRVKMIFLTAAGKKKKFSMIVKMEHKSAGSKEAMKAFPVFRTETRTFTTILPAMEDLMFEFNDYREQPWAELIGYQPYNMIAFRDLSELGYVRAERRNSLDFNHAKLVLKDLARYHAMSKVLLERGFICSDDKGILAIAGEDDVVETWFSCMMSEIAEAMETNWGDEWSGIAKKVRNEMSQISSKVKRLSKEYDKQFDVYNHGDLWTCNLLFKYIEDENEFPISVKFLDFQMGHINSFVWDLAYFFITSVIPSVRRSKLNDLFTIYQQSLEKNLKMYEYDGYIPTLNDVKSEWKRVEYAHLAYFMVQPFMTAETSHALDMEKLTTHPPNEVVHKTVFRDGKAIRGIGEDLRNLEINGLL